MRNEELRVRSESAVPDDAPDSWLWATNALLRNRKLITYCVLVSLLIPIAVLLQKREYTAVSTFMLRSRRSPMGLSGLAAQMGINVPSGESDESPVFYSDL